MAGQAQPEEAQPQALPEEARPPKEPPEEARSQTLPEEARLEALSQEASADGAAPLGPVREPESERSGSLRSLAAEDSAVIVHMPTRAAGQVAPIPSSGVLAWLRRHALDMTALAAVVAAVGVVHGWGMARYPAFFDDEGTYVSQAWAVLKLHALAPYTYWYDHPPLGWLLMAAWGRFVPMFGSGQFAVGAARSFMLVLFVASAVFVYLIARRLGVRWPFAVAAVLLFGLSPLAIHYQRMVLLDNIGVAWLLAALVLALTPSHRLAAYAASGVCLAAAVLTKETFLLFAPAILLAVWQTSAGSSRRFAIGVFVTLFVLIGGFYLLFALLRGEFLQGPGHTSVIYGIKYQLSRPGTGSIFDAASETRAIVRGWFATDPFLLGLAALLTPLALVVRRLRPVALGLALAVLIVVVRPNGYLPPMFVVGMLPFAALVLAGSLDWLWRPLAVGRVSRLVKSPDVHVYRSGGPSRGGLFGLAPGLLALAIVAVLLLGAAPRWTGSSKTATSADPAAPSRQAVDWLTAHASRRAYLLVDDSVWTDLVDRGFARSHTIWYSKLDLDPTLGGVRWNRFTYVVRSSLVPLRDWGPNARSVYTHSTTVASFRYGSEVVQIRKVSPGSSASAVPSTTSSLSPSGG